MPEKENVVLLIIDAQFDFCDPNGALFVPGAVQDVERLASLVERSGKRIDHIIVTLDTHHVLDIAHPGFWQDADGKPPVPFTPIGLADVEAGTWQPVFEFDYVKNYLRQLEAQGEFQHFIWPEHCLVGTRGASLAEPLATVLRQWSQREQKNYAAVMKGLHPLAEHFGVFQAQIPVPGSPETGLNRPLLDDLAQYDHIWLAGEARSHCVATSLRQLLHHAPELAKKVTLLTDCTSDVAGLGHLAEPIYAEARDLGLNFTTSSQLSADSTQ
ncbi:nicotinamidase [Persicitalea jodogahamensis]|uniref:Nicotinamidase n=1 Tax=Persicitalea jodogahamensis TaxID=402147 RepID=A0A8J3D8M9_9BACT|nr:nicotinamidase [Persicitalea jodogahamensis]GHB69075.1 nicotinamidase [Persicitalea jodogahamensis]